MPGDARRRDPATAERLALERWEGEGGRPRAPTTTTGAPERTERRQPEAHSPREASSDGDGADA
jgi:hypothetical protein